MRASSWACDYPVQRDLGTVTWEDRGISHEPSLLDEVQSPAYVYRYRVGAPTGVGHSHPASVTTLARGHWLPIPGVPGVPMRGVPFGDRVCRQTSEARACAPARDRAPTRG